MDGALENQSDFHQQQIDSNTRSHSFVDGTLSLCNILPSQKNTAVAPPNAAAGANVIG